MKKTAQEMMNQINNRLSEYGQSTRIIKWSGTMIQLSTGKVLTGSTRIRFIRRVTNFKTSLWCENIDRLLSGEISDSEIKSQLSAIGGIACQEKHGNLIRKNLNTGIPWNKGLKGNYPYKFGPLPQSVKDKISIKNSGQSNGMFGRRMTELDKKIKADLMQTKILNGTFTPNSNNRNTHWDSIFDNKKYRSSWEALYQYINPIAEYETLRIEYLLDGKRFVYIVDFVDHTNSLVIEVKPAELCVGKKFEAKMLALADWAKEHRYLIIVATREWLQSQKCAIDYSRFDSRTAKKIKALYETS